MRNQWFEENGKVYHGETTCPHCKQELPAAMIEQARDVFTKAQADKCNDITSKGKRIGERIKELEKDIDDVKKDIENANANVTSINGEISKMKADFVALPLVEAAAVVPESSRKGSKSKQKSRD